MALTERTIADSIEWAKRMSFNRNPVIGNSLEPALTSANLVMQTLLGPPFEWWWNNSELNFTCNPTANTATATAIAIAGGILTVTAPNTFAVGDLLLGSTVAGLTALNGLAVKVSTRSGSQFTAAVNLPDGSGTTGTWTNTTTQDYNVPNADFSHISFASVLDIDAAGAPIKWWELKVQNNLSRESSTGRPEFISPNTQNEDGSVTFRVMNAPDKKYPVNIQVQNAAPEITSINQTWAPLPDFMQYVYEWGFLSLIWQFSDDPQRAAYANNQFKAALLGRQDGLTDEEKNIFLNNWDAMTAAQMMKKQQGTQARGQ